MTENHDGPYSSANKLVDSVGTQHELLRKLDTKDEVLAHTMAAARGAGGTLVKIVSSLDEVADAAEKIGDIAKCVAGASTEFQLVQLCARAVLLCAEVHRREGFRRFFSTALIAGFAMFSRVWFEF